MFHSKAQLLEVDRFCYWKQSFQTYVCAKDIDLYDNNFELLISIFYLLEDDKVDVGLYIFNNSCASLKNVGKMSKMSFKKSAWLGLGGYDGAWYDSKDNEG
jgi:hypothetical protein